ncbi:alpha/beta fold hydrolase [Bordetella sp. N]|uniref:alpha/beta fold hydrolase n=1 Tax=Bordetella sp. N TaxID=1746199 RepID=UPI00070DE2AE|nr:alpha/beta hydrolase [Bordetella sp. N]ALM83534.1 hydrolase [Bordetella sp. N]
MTFTKLPAPPAGFSHQFGRANGLRFHYVAGGREDRPALVLLAGFPESWFAWRHVMERLADRYRIVAVDLPGQGDSDKPLSGYDTQTVARRLHDFIGSLGLGRYYLAAHDVGAWVAFPYAMMFDDEIRALTLMDAGIPGVSLPDMLPSSSEKSWKTWHFSFHAVADLPEALLQGRERIYLEWFFREKTANPSCYGEIEMAEYERLLSAPGGLRAGLAFYRSLSESATQNKALAETRRLAMPVLGLSSDQGSIPDMAATLRPYGDDVHSDTILHCGHFQPEEQPEAVAKALARFFR